MVLTSVAQRIIMFLTGEEMKPSEMLICLRAQFGAKNYSKS